MLNDCATIKLRAERRAGELLREMKERGERHDGRGDQKTGSQHATPKSLFRALQDAMTAEFQPIEFAE